uniref:Mab-21-like nucleotidyltransferase domain-containing protein n=1 Tax=Trichogramma kaykai TaxID=54128 RepID=A0ABD2X8V6_9HYME
MASANEIRQNVANLKAIRNIANLGQEEVEQLLKRCNSTVVGIAQFFPVGGEIADNGEEEVDEATAKNSNGEEEENNEDTAKNTNGEEVENNEGTAKQKSNDNLVWKNTERMFKSAIRMGEIVNNTHVDVGVFVSDCFPIFKIKIEDTVAMQPIKCYCVLELEFKSPRIGDEKLISKWFHTNAMVILEATNLSEWYDVHVKAYIDKRIDSFCENGSGWTVNRIIKLTVVMLNYEPFKGASFIPLPKQISNKCAIVNVKNDDNKCFVWSILAALFPAKANHYRVQHNLLYVNELNFGDLEFPIKVCDIDKFEKLNPTIAINLHKLRLKKYIIHCKPVSALKKRLLA